MRTQNHPLVRRLPALRSLYQLSGKAKRLRVTILRQKVSDKVALCQPAGGKTAGPEPGFWCRAEWRRGRNEVISVSIPCTR